MDGDSESVPLAVEGTRLEADSPPVVIWAQLPEPEAALARAGYEAWREGRFDEANASLRVLLGQAQEAGHRDARFHALHLLGCVAFSQGRYRDSRALHEQVFHLSEDIGFFGGQGSSLFDIAMIDQEEGDTQTARRHYLEAKTAYERGGYTAPLPAVNAAIAALNG